MSLAIKASTLRRCWDCSPPPACPRRLSPSWQSAVAKILRAPEIADRLKTLGIHLAENGTAAYAKFMQDDLDRYTKVVKEFHLQIKP